MEASSILATPFNQLILLTVQVVNARAALLSNFEVLGLLKEQEAQRNVAREAALAIKLEDPTARPKLDDVCENLRTVEYEVRLTLFAAIVFVIDSCTSATDHTLS